MLPARTTRITSYNVCYTKLLRCTGFEFAYCCVLPPYNSILAQVVKTEKTATFPRVLDADPNNGLDALGRPTVVRDPVLSGSGFKK